MMNIYAAINTWYIYIYAYFLKFRKKLTAKDKQISYN